MKQRGNSTSLCLGMNTISVSAGQVSKAVLDPLYQCVNSAIHGEEFRLLSREWCQVQFL